MPKQKAPSAQAPPTEVPIHSIVFTDLDGTLLDDRYDLDSAAQAMDTLSEQGAVVIPVSSKTLPELRALASSRTLQTPLIFENGAGIAWPLSLAPSGLRDFDQGDAVQICGPGYDAVCQTISDIRQRFGYRFKGFADYSAKDIANLTGLDIEAAVLAQQRKASEPLCWNDDPTALDQFRKALADRGMVLTRGGRFFHAMPATDKAVAASQIAAAYRKQLPQPLRTIACGDSPNDLALLSFADACALFPRPDGSYLPVSAKPIVCAPMAGSEAWLIAVRELLSGFESE